MKSNIQAAKAVSRVLRTSLGPKGMDKLLQGPDGDIVISERAAREPSAAAAPQLLPPAAQSFASLVDRIRCCVDCASYNATCLALHAILISTWSSVWVHPIYLRLKSSSPRRCPCAVQPTTAPPSWSKWRWRTRLASCWWS